MPIFEHYSLLHHNTFGINAQCRFFAEYSSELELSDILKSSLITKPFFHIGQGSNLLFTKTFEGTILHSSILGYEVISENSQSTLLRIGAGEIWDDVVAYCVYQNLYGTENLSLIPGEIGAAAVQNIGAYGVELKDLIYSVEAIEIATGYKRLFSKEECKYNYRESIFKKELQNQFIITYVTLLLSKNEYYNLEYGNIKDAISVQNITLQNVRQTIIDIRESKLPDPKVKGNAGSFFMNPYISKQHYDLLKDRFPTMPHYPVSETLVKVPAGWLIEHAGWKGKSVGNAGVHDKQALVLVNNGGATADEIVELSNQIRATVNEKFSIDLIPEVIFV